MEKLFNGIPGSGFLRLAVETSESKQIELSRGQGRDFHVGVANILSQVIPSHFAQRARRLQRQFQAVKTRLLSLADEVLDIPCLLQAIAVNALNHIIVQCLTQYTKLPIMPAQALILPTGRVGIAHRLGTNNK